MKKFQKFSFIVPLTGLVLHPKSIIMKKLLLFLFVILISCLGFSQTISWKGITWDVLNGTAIVDGSGHLVLTADGTGQAVVHVNQIATLAGASTPWIQLSYMDVTTAGHKIDMLMEDEAGLYPRFACGSMWTGGEIFALRRQASPTYETYLMFEDTRQNIERTVYVGKRATGTLDVNFDGKKRSSTYLNQIVGGSWGYKDVYLRLRGAAAGATVTFTNFTYGTNHANQNPTEFLVAKDDQNVVMSLKKAVDESAAGDVVNVLSGTYAEASTINLDKAISIIGATSPTIPVIQTAGTTQATYLFNVSASGVIIKNLDITKTNVADQNIIYVGGSNFVLDYCKVHGLYTYDDGTVNRAMVMTGGLSGLQITNNEFYSLRQPLYVSGTTTGNVSNNYTYGTKGWVIEGGNLTFTGNTWGTGAQANVFDIAILSLCPSTYYTDIVAMSAANNNAVIEDQRVTPRPLSLVYVDKNSTQTEEQGSLLLPYKSITPAITRVVAGGTIYVAAGTYSEYITVNKSCRLYGSNVGRHPAVGTHPTEVVGPRLPETILENLSPAADNILIDGFKFLKAGTRIIDTYSNANGFTLKNCIVESTTAGPSTGIIQFGGGSHTGCIFEFNLFKDKGNHTFYAGGGPYDNLKFQYNKFQSKGDAIFWTASALTGGIIDGNEFDGESGSNYNTMNIGQAGNLQITNNRFHDILYTAIQCGIINGSITGNKFETHYGYSTYNAAPIQLWGGEWSTAVSTNVDITNNEIHYNQNAVSPVFGIRLRGPNSSADPKINGSTIHVHNNSFFDGGVRNDAFAILFQGDLSTTVDATCNWWASEATPLVYQTPTFTGPVNFVPYSISNGGACIGGTLITTLTTPTPTSCGTYDLPVTVQNFKNVGAISMKLAFDATVLAYQTTIGVDLNPEISAADFDVSTPGKFVLGWNSLTGITLADNDVLFTLHFNLLPVNRTLVPSTNFTWSSVAGECEFAGPGGTPIYMSTFTPMTWTIPVRPVKNTNTGLEYCKIQDAVNASQTLDGHTITVAAGTYAENVVVNKSLTILGPNFGVAGNSVSRLAEAIIDGETTHSCIGILAQNITIDGFKMINGAGTNSSALYFSGQQTGVKIQNNIFSGNASGVMECSANAEIKNNLFDGNNLSGPAGGSGIYTDFSTDGLVIEGNEFKNHLNNSAVIFGATASTVHQNLHFTNNYIHDNNASNTMVYCVAVKNSTFSANTITQPLTTAIKFAGACESNVVANNFLDNNGTGVKIADDGYNLGANGSVEIHDNSIANCSIYAIQNTGTVSANATCNWYGTKVASQVEAKINGPVTYISWLTDGLDANANPGFQPVANSCSGTPVVIASAVPTDVLCGSTGSIAVTFSGGTANYAINWTRTEGGTGSITDITASPNNITGLLAGNYSITLTDANGSSATTSVLINYLPVTSTTSPFHFPTIQSAINASDPGATITVCAGTYMENIVVNKSGLNIMGANTGISAGRYPGSRGSESIINGSVSLGGSVAGFTLDGFTVNATVANAKLMVGGGSGTIAVKNNIFDGAGLTGTSGIWNGGAFIWSVSENSFSNFKYWALMIDGGAIGAGTYSGNLIANNTGSTGGIILQGSVSTTQLITDNKFVGNTPAVVLGSGNHTLSKNLFESGSGIYAVSAGNLVTENQFTNASYAFYLDAAKTGNVLVSNSLLGGYTSGSNIGKSVFGFAGGVITANCNWWGTTVPMDIQAKVNSNVTFTPWLTSGVDGDLVTHGFQPAIPCVSCALELSETHVDITCFGESNGSIALTVSGGVAPLAYSWTGPGTFTSTVEDLSSLAAGTYNVLVTATNGCTATKEVVIANGDVTLPVITTCPPTVTLDGCSTAAITGLLYSETEVSVSASAFTTAGGIASDNCAVASYSYIDTKLGSCPIVVTRTWKVVDTKGNPSTTCLQTINIQDLMKPDITVPDAITVHVNSGCEYVGSIGAATATDNCTATGTIVISSNAPTSFPLGVTTVTWSAKDLCNNEKTGTQVVTVVTNTLSGTLTYNNLAHTPMNKVILGLYNSSDVQIGSDVTTAEGTGAYSFPDLCAGTYTIKVKENKKDVGGINSTDASAANLWGTSGALIEYVQFLAGDVKDNDLFINSGDAQRIQRFFVFGTAFDRASWSYWKKGATITNNYLPYPTRADHPTNFAVLVSGADVPNFDLYGMCTGDFNRSLIPTTLKSATWSIELNNNSTMNAVANQEFELPLRAASAMQVGAISMILRIPSGLVNVQNILVNGSSVAPDWAVNGDELRIGWYSSTPVNVQENGNLLTLKLKSTNAFTMGQMMEFALKSDPLNELANGNSEVIQNAKLLVALVGNGVTGIHNPTENSGLSLSNYPNPFKGYTTIDYQLPENGKVTIQVYNSLGQLVSSLVDANQNAGNYSIRMDGNNLMPGIYIAKLRLTNLKVDMTGTVKLSVLK